MSTSKRCRYEGFSQRVSFSIDGVKTVEFCPLHASEYIKIKTVCENMNETPTLNISMEKDGKVELNTLYSVQIPQKPHVVLYTICIRNACFDEAQWVICSLDTVHESELDSSSIRSVNVLIIDLSSTGICINGIGDVSPKDSRNQQYVRLYSITHTTILQPECIAYKFPHRNGYRCPAAKPFFPP